MKKRFALLLTFLAVLVIGMCSVAGAESTPCTRKNCVDGVIDDVWFKRDGVNFVAVCNKCHGGKGNGKVHPNLIDQNISFVDDSEQYIYVTYYCKDNSYNAAQTLGCDGYIYKRVPVGPCADSTCNGKYTKHGGKVCNTCNKPKTADCTIEITGYKNVGSEQHVAYYGCTKCADSDSWAFGAPESCVNDNKWFTKDGDSFTVVCSKCHGKETVGHQAFDNGFVSIAGENCYYVEWHCYGCGVTRVYERIEAQSCPNNCGGQLTLHCGKVCNKCNKGVPGCVIQPAGYVYAGEGKHLQVFYCANSSCSNNTDSSGWWTYGEKADCTKANHYKKLNDGSFEQVCELCHNNHLNPLYTTGHEVIEEPQENVTAWNGFDYVLKRCNACNGDNTTQYASPAVAVYEQATHAPAIDNNHLGKEICPVCMLDENGIKHNNSASCSGCAQYCPNEGCDGISMKQVEDGLHLYRDGLTDPVPSVCNKCLKDANGKSHTIIHTFTMNDDGTHTETAKCVSGCRIIDLDAMMAFVGANPGTENDMNALMRFFGEAITYDPVPHAFSAQGHEVDTCVCGADADGNAHTSPAADCAVCAEIRAAQEPEEPEEPTCKHRVLTGKYYTWLSAERHLMVATCKECEATIRGNEPHSYNKNWHNGTVCQYCHTDANEVKHDWLNGACSVCDEGKPEPAPIPDGLNPDDGWYYVDGEKSNFTGLVKYDTGLFYVENGQWQRGLNGLKLIGEDFWFLAGGQVQEHHGFALYDGEWFYLDGEGKLDVTASGVFQYNGKSFLVAAGRLVSEYSGLAQVPSGEWYYVAEGRVLTEFSGVIEWNGGLFQIVNGRMVA